VDDEQKSMDALVSILLGLAAMAGILLAGAGLFWGVGWLIGQGIHYLARWARPASPDAPGSVSIFLGRPPLPGDEIYFDT
jgi:hypothetical protein